MFLSPNSCLCLLSFLSLQGSGTHSLYSIEGSDCTVTVSGLLSPPGLFAVSNKRLGIQLRVEPLSSMVRVWADLYPRKKIPIRLFSISNPNECCLTSEEVVIHHRIGLQSKMVSLREEEQHSILSRSSSPYSKDGSLNTRVYTGGRSTITRSNSRR